MHFVVTTDQHGKTLVGFLKEKCKESLSSNQIKKAIEAKACKINGRIQLFASYQVMSGDQIEFTPLLDSCLQKVSILFQDEYFAVMNKFPGLVCEDEIIHKAIGIEAKNWHLIHRLDKDTSGLLLLAKNKEAEEAAKSLFAKREIQKLYLAVVDGKVKDKAGIIDNKLGKKGSYQGQTLYGEVSEGGLRSITHYRRLSLGDKCSLVLCDLKTGRTHQIRVHFSEHGHPLVGDYQYGRKTFQCPYQASRQLLHAWKLSFIHPFTKLKIELEAPIPEDFQRALKSLFSHSVVSERISIN